MATDQRGLTSGGPESSSVVVHNTAQNSSDNLLSCPPDSHHCSDAVPWRGGNSRTLWVVSAIMTEERQGYLVYRSVEVGSRERACQVTRVVAASKKHVVVAVNHVHVVR